MMIQKNSRQIPKHKIILANKSYQDLVYAWFQSESNLQPDGTRIMPKDRVSYNKMSNELGMYRNTIAKYIQKLVDMQLLRQDEDGNYIVEKLETSIAMLVPFETVRMLWNTLQRNAVSLYVTLLNLYIENDEQPFYTTYVFLKEQIGLSVTTYSNNTVISDRLIVLEKLGLIQWEVKQVSEDSRRLYIKKVTNKIQ